MIGSTEGLLILLVVLVLFGGSQVPKLARALGSSVNSFKKGLKEGEDAELENALRTVSVYEKKEPVIQETVVVEEVKKKVPEKKKGIKKIASKKTTQKTSSKPVIQKKKVAKKTTKNTKK